jgi:hypothetical protein
MALELHSPIRLHGVEKENFACTHLRGSQMEQEPIVRSRENIFSLPKIEPGSFHHAASNTGMNPLPVHVYLQQQQQMNINPPTTGTTQQRKRLETARILK